MSMLRTRNILLLADNLGAAIWLHRGWSDCVVTAFYELAEIILMNRRQRLGGWEGTESYTEQYFPNHHRLFVSLGQQGVFVAR